MVECRYSKSGGVQQSLASVGVMVKTPASTLPATVSSDGLYGVQLRIAKGSIFVIGLIMKYIFGLNELLKFNKFALQPSNANR